MHPQYHSPTSIVLLDGVPLEGDENGGVGDDHDSQRQPVEERHIHPPPHHHLVVHLHADPLSHVLPIPHLQRYILFIELF